MAEKSIDGFDPLVPDEGDDRRPTRYIDEYTKGNVQNILDCYTGYYDVFSEAIQNSLDALQQKWYEKGDTYEPRLIIDVDATNKWVRVVDNGVGMNEEEFKYCFRPHITFKKGEALRGRKGVGATFLAYGFSFVRLQTKQGDNQVAARLEDGRLWAEDEKGARSRPTLSEVEFDVPELEGEPSGTCIEIQVGNHPKEKPTDLTWQGATTAQQWYDVLRVKTPLGGTYLTGTDFDPVVTVRTVNGNSVTDEVTYAKAEYYYPHRIEGLKQADVTDIQKALDSISGDAEKKERELPQKYKKLDCVWEIWDFEEFLDEDSPWHLDLGEADRELLRRHEVTVYGAFVRSVKIWDKFNDEILGLRKNLRILRGGLQMASDYMPQGDLITIPLKRKIGYQHNTHVIVHFIGGSPDMGRKVFQPEYTELAKRLSEEATKFLLQYRSQLKKDAGGSGLSGSTELYKWTRQQMDRADENPLQVPEDLADAIAFVSDPDVEQDVIGLSHELVSAGVLKGYRFIATSAHDRYDGLCRLDYRDGDFGFDLESCPLGIDPEDSGQLSKPLVVEYKHQLSSLVRDFEKEEKAAKNIDLVICWEIDDGTEDLLDIQSFLIGDAGEDRSFYGSTHSAIRPEDRAEFEVIALKDLLEYLVDDDAEERRQIDRYGSV